jgi:hypothetical protein
MGFQPCVSPCAVLRMRCSSAAGQIPPSPRFTCRNPCTPAAACLAWPPSPSQSVCARPGWRSRRLRLDGLQPHRHLQRLGTSSSSYRTIPSIPSHPIPNPSIDTTTTTVQHLTPIIITTTTTTPKPTHRLPPSPTAISPSRPTFPLTRTIPPLDPSSADCDRRTTCYISTGRAPI